MGEIGKEVEPSAALDFLDGRGEVVQGLREIRAFGEDDGEHREFAIADGEDHFENLTWHGDGMRADAFHGLAEYGAGQDDDGV